MNNIGFTNSLAVMASVFGVLVGTEGARGATADRSDNAAVTAEARRIIEQSGVLGGLIVHLDCGDGRLTTALRIGERYRVQGLARDASQRAQAQAHAVAAGLAGPVSIASWDGVHLPYAENLVNLIVAETPGEVAAEEMLRVLAPRGVALVKRDGAWTKTVKPWPEAIDEWTHYLHSPSNNAVSDDAVVAPPQRLQWSNPPLWARSHEHLATLSAAVSARGRLFYIIDTGPTVDVTMAPNWTLIARDAFNGVKLWQRPVGPWEWRLRGFRSGPPEIARRLVAVDDRVYVTLGYGQPVVALDAATGDVVCRYDQTENTQEMVLSDGVLYLVAGHEPPDPAEHARRADQTDERWNWWPIYREPRARTLLLAVRADNGQTLWRQAVPATEHIMPTTLAVADGRVFFQNLDHLICLDANDGQPVWRAQRPVLRRRPAWTAPTLVVYDGVVLTADRKTPDTTANEMDSEPTWSVTSLGGRSPEGELIAFAADTGQRLWSAPAREGYNSPIDVLVAGGLVWTGNLVGAKDPGITQGRDPRTGEVRRTRPRDQQFYEPVMSHARCYRHKGTHRYLLTGRTGVEFMDIASGKAFAHHWVRGECQYGIIPCNGLLYAPPHPCACFIHAKLNSFLALAPASESPERVAAAEDRLEKGPAYEAVTSAEVPAEDWPTYRNDAARSGSTAASVSANLAPAWTTPLPAPLSAPVAAGGRVYVASVDAHTLYALDERTGSPVWHFTASGRVDSPPTIYNGRVLLGSADGYVYCLRADDGALVWRHRAAPTDRQVMVHGQLESAWPVHGSVLVLPGADSRQATVVASAGRSSFLDGGIAMVRMDAETGREISRSMVDSRDAETGHQPHPLQRPTPGFSMPGALNDVLSAREDLIFMRHLGFSPAGELQDEAVPHLHSPAGFLDDSWWHRTYWLIGTGMHSGWAGWPTMGTLVPSGRLLVQNDTTVYGFGRDRYHRDGSHVGLGGANYRLFAQRLTTDPRRKQSEDLFLWSQPVKLLVRAMVLADKTLFIAGPGDAFAADDPAAVWEGRAGGLLWAVCADSGEKLAEYDLDTPPVFDGLIATPGRLLFSTTDGRVVSFTALDDTDQTP